MKTFVPSCGHGPPENCIRCMHRLQADRCPRKPKDFVCPVCGHGLETHAAGACPGPFFAWKKPVIQNACVDLFGHPFYEFLPSPY